MVLTVLAILIGLAILTQNMLIEIKKKEKFGLVGSRISQSKT